METSNQLAAVISLGVLCGVFLLLAIGALVACLLYKRRSSALELQLRELEAGQAIRTEKLANGKQVNSLPCRLKKRPKTGHDRSASESGVYDMAGPKQGSISALYTTGDGTAGRVSIHGSLGHCDQLILRSALCSYISSRSTVDQSSQCIPTMTKQSSRLLNPEDIVVTGFEEMPSTNGSVGQDNRGYSSDENLHPTGASVKRNWSIASMSSLARIRRKLSLSKDSSTQLLPMNGTTQDHSAWKCVTSKSSVIGSGGGDILLLGGVKLCIPSEALNEKTALTFGVTWDDKLIPTLDDQQCMLSPVVFCQPNGQKFLKPVALTIPHSAIDPHSDWKISIYRTQTDPSTEPNWQPLQIGEYDSRVINKRSVLINVNHFTMYCIVGLPKPGRHASKSITLIPLAQPLAQGQNYTLSIYAINSYGSEGAEARSVESEADGAISLPLTNSGQNVTVQLEGLSEDWSISGSSQQELDYIALWHNTMPTVSVSLQPVEESTNEVSCELVAWQKGREKTKCKLTVLDDLQATTPSSGSYTVFSEPLRWDIMLLLDPPHPEGNDWHRLATEMGISGSRVQIIENCKSPTKELLKIWEQRVHGCIKSFLALALKMDRHDIADKIEASIGKVYLETLQNHKCDKC